VGAFIRSCAVAALPPGKVVCLRILMAFSPLLMEATSNSVTRWLLVSATNRLPGA